MDDNSLDDNWLDIAKDPPPLGEYVLLCTRDESAEGWAEKVNGKIVWRLTRRPAMNLLYPPRCWQPLPASPKNGAFPYKE